MNTNALPIQIGIARSKAGGSSLGKPASKDLPAEIRKKVFERDNYTCQYCGFHAQKYQDVHFSNNNPNDHHFDNLVTACVYCSQCFDLEKTAQMRSGVLIWLPEIEQADLHHIARAIYIARISQGSMADMARKALDILMKRREDAKERLGTDDPSILATVMKDFLLPQHYAMREKKLKGVKLFPLDRRIIKEGDLEFNQFPQILAYWRSKDGPFGGRIPHQWKQIYANLKNAA